MLLWKKDLERVSPEAPFIKPHQKLLIEFSLPYGDGKMIKADIITLHVHNVQQAGALESRLKLGVNFTDNSQLGVLAVQEYIDIYLLYNQK